MWIVYVQPEYNLGFLLFSTHHICNDRIRINYATRRRYTKSFHCRISVYFPPHNSCNNCAYFLFQLADIQIANAFNLKRRINIFRWICVNGLTFNLLLLKYVTRNTINNVCKCQIMSYALSPRRLKFCIFLNLQSSVNVKC